MNSYLSKCSPIWYVHVHELPNETVNNATQFHSCDSENYTEKHTDTPITLKLVKTKVLQNSNHIWILL